jgi:hypothetical protein
MGNWVGYGASLGEEGISHPHQGSNLILIPKAGLLTEGLHVFFFISSRADTKTGHDQFQTLLILSSRVETFNSV